MYVWSGNAGQKSLRERERGERGGGKSPRETRTHAHTHFLFVVLYLAQPLQQQRYLFSCRWKHMHGGVFISIRAPLSHVKLHARTHTCAGWKCPPRLRRRAGNAVINNSALTLPCTHLPTVLPHSHERTHAYARTHARTHIGMRARMPIKVQPFHSFPSFFLPCKTHQWRRQRPRAKASEPSVRKMCGRATKTNPGGCVPRWVCKTRPGV